MCNLRSRHAPRSWPTPGRTRLRKAGLARPGVPDRRAELSHVQPVAAPLRLGIDRLHQADPALRKPALAVGEVHAPQPAEALVVAARVEVRSGGLEVLAPAAE